MRYFAIVALLCLAFVSCKTTKKEVPAAADTATAAVVDTAKTDTTK